MSLTPEELRKHADFYDEGIFCRPRNHDCGECGCEEKAVSFRGLADELERLQECEGAGILNKNALKLANEQISTYKEALEVVEKAIERVTKAKEAGCPVHSAPQIYFERCICSNNHDRFIETVKELPSALTQICKVLGKE